MDRAALMVWNRQVAARLRRYLWGDWVVLPLSAALCLGSLALALWETEWVVRGVWVVLSVLVAERSARLVRLHVQLRRVMAALEAEYAALRYWEGQPDPLTHKNGVVHDPRIGEEEN